MVEYSTWLDHQIIFESTFGQSSKWPIILERNELCGCNYPNHLIINCHQLMMIFFEDKILFFDESIARDLVDHYDYNLD